MTSVAPFCDPLAWQPQNISSEEDALLQTLFDGEESEPSSDWFCGLIEEFQWDIQTKDEDTDEESDTETEDTVVVVEDTRSLYTIELDVDSDYKKIRREALRERLIERGQWVPKRTSKKDLIRLLVRSDFASRGRLVLCVDETLDPTVLIHVASMVLGLDELEARMNALVDVLHGLGIFYISCASKH